MTACSFQPRDQVVFQFIFLAAFGTGSEPVPIESQRMSELTDPARLPGGVTHHQGIILHLFGHHRAGAYESIFTDVVTTHDRCVGAYGGPFAHVSADILSFTDNRAPRVPDIGKNTGRPQEYIVLDGDTCVYGDIVLDLNIGP